jgi:hypothetical protein
MANVVVTANLEEVIEAFTCCVLGGQADLPGDLAYDIGTLRRRLSRAIKPFEQDVKKPRLLAVAERDAKGRPIYTSANELKIDPTELAALEEEIGALARAKKVTLSVPDISATSFPGISGTPAKKGQTLKPDMFSGLGPFLKEYREADERARKEDAAADAGAQVPDDDDGEDDDEKDEE